MDYTTKTFAADKYTGKVKASADAAQEGHKHAHFERDGVIMQAPNYVDGSDAYANNDGMVVSFYHVPSGRSIYFKAFITAFNETYSSDWAREVVFGRTDPIYMFKQTDRRITLALKVPAGTISEAYENLGKVQTLAQFLYPSYVEAGSATTIAQSPLVRIKVMNLLRVSPNSLGQSESRPSAQQGTSNEEVFWEYTSTSNAESGLLGVINSLAINHNLENSAIGVIEKQSNTILPKMVEINIEFSPIHEETLGWNEDKEPMSPTFPYGVVLTDESTTSPDTNNAQADDPNAINTAVDGGGAGTTDGAPPGSSAGTGTGGSDGEPPAADQTRHQPTQDMAAASFNSTAAQILKAGDCPADTHFYWEEHCVPYLTPDEQDPSTGDKAIE